MSGIYIKGMEMPKRGEMLVVLPDGTAQRVLQGIREPLAVGTAIPVPPHGRLKDYDSVMERYSKWFRNTESREYENMFYMLHNEFRDAPTIIPADKEE